MDTDNQIEGTYVGTLTFENELKSTTDVKNGSSVAAADVTNLGDGQLEVHCYSTTSDTTFTLNYYGHNDSVMVSLNNEAFEDMYGHMMGNGGMMGNGSTEWMNHMNRDHTEGD